IRHPARNEPAYPPAGAIQGHHGGTHANGAQEMTLTADDLSTEATRLAGRPLVVVRHARRSRELACNQDRLTVALLEQSACVDFTVAGPMSYRDDPVQLYTLQEFSERYLAPVVAALMEREAQRKK